uniref:Parathyroid hormone n=1 Tax=Acanthochromis polyacanthus TaxID=80966 RepID=A0A3Q1EHA4_9TELE
FQVSMQLVDYKLLLVSLCVLNLSVPAGGRPLRKRTVSEVQLMHDLGEHQQVQERREWLQMSLRGIHTAALRPEDVPELSDLTSEEIQHALSFLEKLLKASPDPAPQQQRFQE